MLKASRRQTGRIFAGVFSIFLLAGSAWFVLNREYVNDIYNFWQYTPPVEIADITERADLSEKGKFYLYTSHAEINDAAQFNANCERREEKNAVLGCYTNGRIYVYDVGSAELDGIKEVTAAHEMLHAAWVRLDDKEKARLGQLLESAYEQNITPELQARMDYYSRNEEGERHNELHSIIGTEVDTLSQELERYYSQYFDNKDGIVELFKKYNQIFERLLSESDAIYNELTELEKSVIKVRDTYSESAVGLDNDIKVFNARAKTGDFDSRDQFNQERATIEIRVDEVNATYVQFEELIRLYNEKYQEYQKLLVKNATLNEAIDSTVKPVPSL